ncbi:MAG: SDR family oxidoreductase [Oleiphilaceae bacterium]|nr:SDR family oxidoreductase [Oleiphilaceae bacterium]
MKLQDAVIVITGGAQGLGKEFATHLADKGAKLALIDLNKDTLLATKAELEAQSVEVRVYACNVADEAQVCTTFEAIRQDYGHIDGLINNAGILRDAMLLKVADGKVSKKMSLAEWQAVIDVNLTGVFLCGREAASIMIETKREGCIVNISSIARAGNIGQTNYSAAKAGVVAMTTTWAKELARYGIRSMAVAPGFIATEMTASMKPEALARMQSIIPIGKVGQPEHIASTIAHIFENDYLSGRVIEVDGALRI